MPARHAGRVDARRYVFIDERRASLAEIPEFTLLSPLDASGRPESRLNANGDACSVTNSGWANRNFVATIPRRREATSRRPGDSQNDHQRSWRKPSSPWAWLWP
jgi:hypothetical protein